MSHSYKKHTFKNGLRLILVSRPESLATTVLILVKAGSEYETKKQNGISHFLEHMMFKGTKNRPKSSMIAEELDALGAEYNAFTSQEYTGYFAKAENHKVPQIFDIVSDLYLNPIFDPQEIDKERGVVIEEINMYKDMPMRQVETVFEEVMYGDQPAGWPITGEVETIKRLAREEFVSYREAHYVAPGTVVIVAGDFKEAAVMSQAEKIFAQLPRKRVLAKAKTADGQSRPKSLVKFKESDQSHFIIGVPVFDMFDPRKFALSVLSDVLGGGMSSRLFKRVRDELGAAYYVRSSADLALDHGSFAVSAGVDHKKIEMVIRAVIDEFRRLVSTPVPEAELKKAKDHLIGGIIMGLETSDEVAGYFGTQEILAQPVLFPEDVIRKVNNVSVSEVQKLAREILKAKKLNLAVIGPYKKPDTFQKLLKF